MKQKIYPLGINKILATINIKCDVSFKKLAIKEVSTNKTSIIRISGDYYITSKKTGEVLFSEEGFELDLSPEQATVAYLSPLIAIITDAIYYEKYDKNDLYVQIAKHYLNMPNGGHKEVNAEIEYMKSEYEFVYGLLF